MSWPVTAKSLPAINTASVRSLSLASGDGVAEQGVGVAVAHAVILLEPFDELHLLGRWARPDGLLPLGDRPPELLLDR